MARNVFMTSQRKCVALLVPKTCLFAIYDVIPRTLRLDREPPAKRHDLSATA